MALAQLIQSDGWVWEARLWRATGRPPATLSLRQRIGLVYAHLVDGKNAQGRELIDAALEDRIAMDLTTGQPFGLDSPDPEIRHRTRLRVLEFRRAHPDVLPPRQQTSEGPYG